MKLKLERKFKGTEYTIGDLFIDGVFFSNILEDTVRGLTDKNDDDRIDNNIGHTKLNVVPCCYTCNTARNNNFTHNEMFILGETIKQIKLNRNEVK